MNAAAVRALGRWRGPVRMIQPNLRMTDARGLDGARLVRQCASHGANAVLLNAGGIVAWYPTALPWHWRNPLLDHDFVGTATREAARRGMRTLLRMDWSCLVPSAARGHRDWMALDAAGRPKLEWGDTAHPLFRMCPERPYWKVHAFRALEELMSRYEFDGFFFNAWDLPDCRCPECRAAFKEETREPFPKMLDRDAALGRAWWAARGRRHAAFTKDLNARIKRFSPATLCSVDFHLTNDHPHHLFQAGWNGALLADAVDLVTVEAFNFLNRPRPHWPFWAEEEARMIRSFPAAKPGIVLLSGSERGIGRRVAGPPVQLERDLAQIVAHGAIPCVAFSGDFRQEDPALPPVVRRVFRRLAANPPSAQPPSTRAAVALAYPMATLDRYGGSASRERSLFHYRGWYEALAAGGRPFAVVHDGVLEAALATGRYRVLILPNAACLSEAQCRAVDRWVAGGGRLVCDFETSRCDERGRRRAGFGLRSIRRRPRDVVAIPGTWSAVSRRDRALTGRHAAIQPVAGEFVRTRGGMTGRLPVCDWTYNNKPEWAQPDRMSGQHACYESRSGRGRVRYVPFGAGKLFHLTASPAAGSLLRRVSTF